MISTEEEDSYLTKHLSRLLDYVKAHENPFIISTNIPITLHSFVTKQRVDDTIKIRYMKVIENGLEEYQKFRTERYVEKTDKLSATIHKISLPAFGADPNSQ